MKCVIYFIKCKSNDKMYIGSCFNYERRIKEHTNELMRSTHKNKLLQADFNYYGKSNIEFGIIEECEESNAIEKENQYMDYYKSYIMEYGTDFGYNLVRSVRVENNALKKEKKNTDNYKKAMKGNGNAKKLSIEECQDIYDEFDVDTGELIKEKQQRLCEKYNVSKNTIGSIRNKTHWSAPHLRD